MSAMLWWRARYATSLTLLCGYQYQTLSARLYCIYFQKGELFCIGWTHWETKLASKADSLRGRTGPKWVGR